MNKIKADEAAKNELQPDHCWTYKRTPQTDLLMECFLASGKKDKAVPAIVFFFGGGWTHGSTSQFYPFAKELTNLGIQCYCAQYRINATHGTEPRNCVEDGVSAIRALRKFAEREGIDPHRITAGGGSAGAHVAVATALCAGFDTQGEDLSVSAVPDALLLYNPVYDNGPEGYAHDRVKSYWQQISPLHNIKAGMPPSVVFLGSEDDLIPVRTAKTFQAKAQAAGAQSELHIYEGEGHGFFNFGRTAYPDVLKKSIAFLKQLDWC